MSQQSAFEELPRMDLKLDLGLPCDDRKERLFAQNLASHAPGSPLRTACASADTSPCSNRSLRCLSRASALSSASARTAVGIDGRFAAETPRGNNNACARRADVSLILDSAGDGGGRL